jgi:deoxyadenosine/deoxycytidine kinase
MKQKHTLTVIIGNVATGKSVLTRALASNTGARPIMADELFKTNPFFSLAVKDRPRWSFISDTWFLQARYEFMQKIARMLEKESLVIDSGIYMSYVYAYSKHQMQYFTADELKLYLKMCNFYFSQVVHPDRIILLSASINTSLMRIQDRGREFEKVFHSQEYLESIDFGLKKLVSLLKNQNIPVIKVNTDQRSLDQIVEDISTL